MIDATIVRAHQYSSGAKGVRSRGGLSTKIHVTVDVLDKPAGFLLTPGQAHDLKGADVLLKDTPAQAAGEVSAAAFQG